jgi:predicted RND superfamily exporter protein
VDDDEAPASGPTSKPSAGKEDSPFTMVDDDETPASKPAAAKTKQADNKRADKKPRAGPTRFTMLGGFAVLFYDLVDAVVYGQVSSLALSLLLVVIIVALLFRSLVAGLLAGGTLGLAMAFLFGLMGLLGIELNLPTALLSSIMIGVGVDYTIHFLWRYRVERRAGRGPNDAVVRTLTTTGRGIIINALSVIIGFAVMLISSFVPVRYFGFLVVVSISACLLGAMVLMPALVLLIKPKFLEPKPVTGGA